MHCNVSSLLCLSIVIRTFSVGSFMVVLVCLKTCNGNKYTGEEMLRTTVQVTRLPLLHELLKVRHDLLLEALYILNIHL